MLRRVVLSLVLFASAFALPALAQSHRPGIRVRFASLDTQGGLEANAFLLISTRDVRVLAPGSGHACPRAPRIEAIARQNRGPVREIRLRLSVPRAMSAPISARACPRAEIETVLEDGTTLSGGDGEVVVSELHMPDGFARGTYTHTVIYRGAPFTIRGSFAIPLRRGARP